MNVEIDIVTVLVALITLITTLLASFLGFRRTNSKIGVEKVEDAAEKSVIRHLEKQRDKASLEAEKLAEKLQQCEHSKIDAITKVNNLSREVEHLTGQIKILKDLVDRLGDSLDAARKEVRKYTTDNAKLLAKIEYLGGSSERHSQS